MALRVDFSDGLNVKERLTELIGQMPEQAKSYGSVESVELGASKMTIADDKPLLAGCGVCAGDVRRDLPEDPEKAEKIILVLKLCLAHLATGQATVDTEAHVTDVAEALGLGALRVDLGPRRMLASFGEHSTVHFLETNRGIVLDKLADVTDLTILLANGFTQDAGAANIVLDEIMDSPTPYGWLVDSFLFWMLSTLAATCAFFGSYYDMAVVAVIVFIVAILQQVIAKFPATLGPIDVILVSIVVGICSSFAWRYILDAKLEYDMCHVSVLFLSPLLVYLPGSELVYGAYEVKMGNFIAGSSRLVAATVRCMFMASGLTIGWQVFGHGDAKEHAVNAASASLVPASQCKPFDSDDINANNVGPWWLVFGVYNLVLLIPCLGGLNIRPKHFFGTYLVAYPSLVLFGALNFACEEPGCGLPSYLISMIGLFVATSLACIREHITGIPAVAALIPVLLVLAPGSTAVLDMLKLMQETNGVINAGITSDIFIGLVFVGVSYALGMVLGFAAWTPLLKKNQAKKVKAFPKATELKNLRRSTIMDKF